MSDLNCDFNGDLTKSVSVTVHRAPFYIAAITSVRVSAPVSLPAHILSSIFLTNLLRF